MGAEYDDLELVPIVDPSGSGLPDAGKFKMYLNNITGGIRTINNGGAVAQYLADANWNAPGLATNWANTGGGTETIGYKKVGSFLYWKGRITRSTAVYTLGTQILSAAPAAQFRPSTTKQGMIGWSVGGVTPVLLEYDTAGVLTCTQNIGIGGVLLIHGMIYLDA